MTDKMTDREYIETAGEYLTVGLLALDCTLGFMDKKDRDAALLEMRLGMSRAQLTIVNLADDLDDQDLPLIVKILDAITKDRNETR